ncbi:response regulator [Paenibacillus sepulcri]|uniref:Response regulator n=1 Tax=Paenibacillus sepulcri TaxID=359917 RepID=A0ABS7CAI3_9BACL|nr:response regulator [Paenibacillus sepulcri]
MFTILVVDDEPNVRIPVCRMLSQLTGVDNVLEAGDGEEALKLLDQHEVQLIITDIRMPRMDGLELAGRVKDRFPNSQLYILTGHAEFDYALKAMEHQVAGYLLKPLSKQKLLDVFDAAYAKYRERYHVHQVDTIRSSALLEKRIHDLLHDLPLPKFDENLIPPFEQISLVSFSTRDLQSLGEPSVRYFIRNSAYEAFGKLGVPVVCLEERLITIVLFTARFDRALWEELVNETVLWIQEKLRIPIKTGYGGHSSDIGDIGMMYVRCVVNLGFTELSRRGASERLAPIVRSLIAYIHKEYAGSAQLADFAQTHQVNANYLSNLFHQETGMTYSQYLTHHRLMQAKRLLRESNLKIYEVCEQAGYRDPAYFSRIFKMAEGMSPNDYRLCASLSQH